MVKYIDKLPNNWDIEELLSFYSLSLNKFSLDQDPQFDSEETEIISELANTELIGIKDIDSKNGSEFYHFLPTKIEINLATWIYFKREDKSFEIDEFNSGEIYFIVDGVNYELTIEEMDDHGITDEKINEMCNENYIKTQIEQLNENYESECQRIERYIQEEKEEHLRAQEKKKFAPSIARKWLSSDVRILDSETTGLDGTAQIIELAIFDVNGDEVFYSKLKPNVAIHEEAQLIHGISLESLVNAPNWNDVSKEVERCLTDHSVIIFNVAYDLRLLKQTAEAFNDPAPWIAKLEAHCAMYLAADRYGSTNKYGSISLANATRAAGVVWRGEAHGAKADTLATLDLIKAIGGEKE